MRRVCFILLLVSPWTGSWACQPPRLIEASSHGEDTGTGATAGSSSGSSSNSSSIVSSSGTADISTSPLPTGSMGAVNGNYNASECLADLTRDMNHAGDAKKMNEAQKAETVAAIMSAAQRYFAELDTRTVARIMISNMRQESDFDPNNISGERDGSGNAYGLLQVSPFGDSKELAFWVAHADLTGLVDYRTQAPYKLSALSANDLMDPWLNVHVATWLQSNLGRSGSEDPSNWGKAQGSQPADYLTALGSYVAGPNSADVTGYNRSGDNISAEYFKGILIEFNFLSGKSDTTAAFTALKIDQKVVYFKP